MEMTVEIQPKDGSWKQASEIIKKICEAYGEKCQSLRIVVKDVTN